MKESSVSLRSIPLKTVGPEGLLYVRQREFAVVAPSSGRYYYTYDYCSLFSVLELVFWDKIVNIRGTLKKFILRSSYSNVGLLLLALFHRPN